MLEYDIGNGGKGWLVDLVKITELLHLPYPAQQILYDLEAAKKSLSWAEWWLEAEEKPKFDSYLQFLEIEMPAMW